ncbi:type I secretion C-terminal target domain-containing protein, partial [Gallaecimonas xiamenensis]
VTLSAAGASWNAATQTLSADNGDWQIVVNNDGTYTVTQLQVMSHPDSSNPNDAIDVEVTMVVTDNEGDPADTTFTVSFLDDGPIAVDDQTSQGAEDAPVLYNVLANDTLGADGATLTDAVVSSGLGSVQFNADGTVTYTPAAGEEGTVIINYTLTDGDGDTDQATLTIQLGPDSTPTLSAQDAVLDETGGLDSVNRSFTASYGNDSAGTVTLSAAGATWNAATQTLSADNGDWQIVVNNDGTYTVTQLQVMNHPDSSNPNDAIDVEVTMVVTDNEGDPADTTFTVSFLDDGPSLTADNLSIANLAGQYQGHYDFNIGADTQAFTASFDGNSLAWTNAPDGYELVFDAGASTANSLVFNGVFNDGADVFFTVQINQDGTYDFNLVTPEPVVEVPVGSLLSGISGGSGLSSYTFDDTQFGGYFDIVVTGTSQGNPATLTISSTDLGVNDNVMHGNKQDVLRFDVVQQVAGASLSQLTIDIAGTGGAKATDMVTYTVYYTDGSSQTVSEAIGSDFAVVIGTDTGRTVDYVELSPYDSAVSFKIDGLSANYVVTEYPDDYQLNFNLAGVDGDGDGASSGFSVNVTTSEGSGYELHGSDNADVLYGTAGNDMLYGGDGNDILAGGLGNDLLSGGQGADSFHWSQGETGTDTITDFSQGTDVLDLAELLVGEEGGSLESYLSFELIGGDTHILVDAQGDGSGTDQTIILQGVDLSSIGSDGDIIQSLLQSGSLLVDPATVTSTNVSPPPSPNGMESDSQLHVYL